MAKQVFNAWTNCIKLAWQVPRGTHTYFVDRMLACGISHTRDDILARYVTFLKALRKSPSKEVSVLVNIVGRDIRTTTGNNLHLVRDLTGLDPWSCSSGQVKKVLGDRLSKVPAQDMWRLGYPVKLLEKRGEAHHQMLDTLQLTELIDSLCVN